MIIESMSAIDGKIQIILEGTSDLDLRDYVALQQACKDKQNITLKALPDEETRQKIRNNEVGYIPSISLVVDELIDLSSLG